MFNLHRAFELSLRGRDASSTHKDPAAFAAVHKHCMGKAHASGSPDQMGRNVVKSDSNSSIRSRSSSRAADCYIEIRNIEESSTNGNASKDKLDYVKSFSNSTSSFEGHSDTDSSENSKSDNPKINGNVDEKFLRLHTTSTKASLAKTAKMRYLEDMSPTCDESPTLKIKSFNGNDHNNGFGKNSDHSGDSKSFVRSPLRSSLRDRSCSPASPRSFNQKKPPVPEPKPNDSPSNGKPPIAAKSFLVLDSPLAKPRAGSFRGPSTQNQKPPWNSVYAKVSPKNFVRTGSLRGSFNNRKKKYPCVSEYWKELIALAEKRKYGWLTIGKDGQGLLKELQEMIVGNVVQETVSLKHCRYSKLKSTCVGLA